MNKEVTQALQWSMPGGMKFRKYNASRGTGLIEIPPPTEVLIPIAIAKGDALVSDGDLVKTGQPLVPEDKIIPRQFHLSTVTGRVDHFIFHGKGTRAPTTIVIERTDEDEYWNGEYESAPDAPAARLQMVRSGIVHACSEGVGRWLLGEENAVVDTILVTAFSTAPLGCSGVGIALDNSDMFKAGLTFWRNAASDASVSIAMLKEDEARWQEVGLEGISFIATPNRYPYENPVILASAMLGRDLPAGDTPLNNGVLVVDLAAVLAAGKVAVSRRPLTDIRVELLGEGFKNNTTLAVRIGQSAEAGFGSMLAKPSKLVTGGLLAGESLPMDRPIVPHHIEVVALPLPERRFMGFAMPAATRHSWTRTVLSSLLPTVSLEAKAEVGGEERPCISCGACEEVCPRGISPSYLAKAADAEIVEETEQYGIDRCIRCGLCSYVCPSKIDLLGKIVSGIDRLEAERAE